jgi:hypothetical protein
MADQVVKTPEQIQEEVLSEETDKKIETKSAVWNQRINLELTERKMRKAEKKVVENGEKQKLVEIDEDQETTQVSYPSPGKVYSQEAERITTEVGNEPRQREEDKNIGKQSPQLVLVKVNLSRPEPREKQVVEVNTSEEELRPTTGKFEGQDAGETGTEEIFEVSQVESFSFSPGSRPVRENTEPEEKRTEYREAESSYPTTEGENFSLPETPLEKPFTPDFETDEGYISGGQLEPETSGEESYRTISRIVDDFEDAEGYEVLGDAVLRAKYSSDSEVTDRLVMDLESMFPYRDEVSGTEAVETLWQEYGVEATVGEVPYFSENSGESWEEGWNSFDMVLQMEGMDMTATEYLSGDLYELGSLEQPVQNSIDTDFSTDQSIEFRESEGFGACNSGYEASQPTKEAWVEEYGDEILELDPIERGVYAAFEDGESFGGAPVEPGEIGFMSDDAAELL